MSTAHTQFAFTPAIALPLEEDIAANTACQNLLHSSRAETVCFTGHRHLTEEEIRIVQPRLETAVRAYILAGFSLFITGGALGFDTLAQKTVTALRAEFPFIRAILAVPCRGQADKWKHEDQQVYRRILAEADGHICLQEEYTPDCMMRRNRFMVDHSVRCIAYHNGTPHGGTAATVRYAEKKGLPVCNLFFPLEEQLSLLPEEDAAYFENYTEV